MTGHCSKFGSYQKYKKALVNELIPLDPESLSMSDFVYFLPVFLPGTLSLVIENMLHMTSTL